MAASDAATFSADFVFSQVQLLRLVLQLVTNLLCFYVGVLVEALFGARNAFDATDLEHATAHV